MTELKPIPPAGVPQKIVILDNKDPSNLTVIIYEEDHTIGNSLKHIICQMPNVEFCGYSVPHPLEDKILLRVQTKKHYPAADVLLEAFTHLETVFERLGDKFQNQYDKYCTRNA